MCYLAAGAVLLLLGRQRVYAGGIIAHLAVLAAVAAATFWRRLPSWFAAWTPLAAILFLYTELPMLIRATGYGRFFDDPVISWETAIFGGQPALDWARSWPQVWLSEALHATYLSYYAIIVSVPLLLWLARRREDFPEAVFALVLTFVSCFVCYIAFPVEGPRYLWRGTAPDGPVRAATLALLESRSSPGTAFPSSHVAVASAQALLAVRYFGARGLLLLPFAIGLAVGAVYGGFHYAIDVVAGAILGILIALAGLEVFALIPRSEGQANATAPTNPLSADDSGSSTSSSGTAST